MHNESLLGRPLLSLWVLRDFQQGKRILRVISPGSGCLRWRLGTGRLAAWGVACVAGAPTWDRDGIHINCAHADTKNGTCECQHDQS